MLPIGFFRPRGSIQTHPPYSPPQVTKLEIMSNVAAAGACGQISMWVENIILTLAGVWCVLFAPPNEDGKP